MKKSSDGSRDESKPAVRLVGRRRLIKVVAAGGGVATGAALVPSKWTQPIIESVTLPVHAQTTTQSVTFAAPLTSSVGRLERSRGPASPLDSMLTPAHAEEAPELAPISNLVGACIIITFFADRVDVQINPFSSSSLFGSLANPSGNAFDVVVSGPYIVGVFPNTLPFPNNVNGIVIGDGGSINYNATQNGICVPSDVEPTPTSG